MSEELGFAIIGAGMISPFHANAIRDSSGGRLVTVCDLDKDRADKMAADYGARACYSVDEMLKDEEVRIVNVVTPNHLHHDAVVQCADAGRHVITEKPPAMSLTETDNMIAACEKAGVKFGCTVQCRVRPAVQAIRKAMDEGRFGKVLQADAYMKWFRATEYYESDAWRSSRKSGAGVTVQHAFHYIDLLQHLVGPVAGVEARMTNLNHPTIDLEDTLCASITYENGASGVVQASTAFWPGSDIRIEINGTDGAVTMVGESITAWKFRDERPEDADMLKIGDKAQATGAGGSTDFSYADHQAVVQDMIEAVNVDREVVIPTRSVRHTVEIALAMYQSAARNAPVNLPIKDDPTIWD
ncbi:MAG: Gfo/Idh/MocA family oxidoreductase [Lentisphaerae bacterium]|nr:Gfo/Idh/MocA family oxidoreductase [Lentisphaerota bacterium]